MCDVLMPLPRVTLNVREASTVVPGPSSDLQARIEDRYLRCSLLCPEFLNHFPVNFESLAVQCIFCTSLARHPNVPYTSLEDIR